MKKFFFEVLKVHRNFKPTEGVHPLKFWIALHKTYFDTGWGLMNYFKYFFLGSSGIGLIKGSSEMLYGSLIALGALSYALGIIYYAFDFARVQVDIGNQVNPFVEQMLKTKEK